MFELTQFRNALRDFKRIKSNVPISWIEVFIEIALKEGQSLQEIAKRTDKQEASISQITDYLESFALIVKRKDRKEYRVRRLFLTDHGKMLIQNLKMHFMRI